MLSYESLGMNKDDQFILQSLFVTHNNEDSQRFLRGWNHHKIRTTDGNLSPVQLLLPNNELYLLQNISMLGSMAQIMIVTMTKRTTFL